jgi:drug/metabolite transporter (DMT)-like permease
MSPVIVITLAAIFLKEKATRWQIAGIVVALIAILLLSFETGQEDSPVSGWLWIVLAILVLFAWGIQGFFMKFANNSMDAESIFVWMALSGLVLIPVAWYMSPDAAAFFAAQESVNTSLGCFGIQILNSIGALTLVYAYRYGKAVIVSPMEGLSPMVTVLLSLIILSVIPNPLQIAGICCAAFAMYALSK